MCLSGTVDDFLEVTKPLAADLTGVHPLSTADFINKNYFMEAWEIFISMLRSAESESKVV